LNFVEDGVQLNLEAALQRNMWHETHCVTRVDAGSLCGGCRFAAYCCAAEPNKSFNSATARHVALRPVIDSRATRVL
jgi:hypothetical protein